MRIRDFKNIKPSDFFEKNYISYIIEQEKNNKLIIIHNASSEVLNLQLDELSEPEKWSVILDNKLAGIKAIDKSDVNISLNKISIPRKSSAVIQSK